MSIRKNRFEVQKEIQLNLRSLCYSSKKRLVEYQLLYDWQNSIEHTHIMPYWKLRAMHLLQAVSLTDRRTLMSNVLNVSATKMEIKYYKQYTKQLKDFKLWSSLVQDEKTLYYNYKEPSLSSCDFHWSEFKILAKVTGFKS